MSGVGVSGLIANLPATVTPYPTQDPALELGGYRSVPNAAARDAIPANFRAIGMLIALQDTGVLYQLVGGILNANWTPIGNGTGSAFIIRANLAALASEDNANFPNGCQAYVIAERETYQLDTASALTTYSPLIVARGAGAGKWYRRSRAYVVGNFTMWCQSFGFGALGYTPGQLLVSGATEPDISLNLGPLHATTGQQDILPDASGNLWLAANNGSYTATAIRKYLLQDCLVSGTPTAAVVLTPPPALTEAGGIIFDRFGGLLSANGTHAAGGVTSFVRYGQREYSRTGGSPSLTLTASGAFDTSNQQDQVFDASGNLWVSIAFTNSSGGAAGIIMFTSAQVAAGGAQVPTVFWAGSNFLPTLGGIECLAFDSAGKLWASNLSSGNSIRAWSTAGAVSGNPAPAVTLTSASFSFPYGLAFDAAGNLWVANGANNKVMRIPAASLAVSGVVVPDVVISPVVAQLFSRITFPANPDRRTLPAGAP